ncbi:MAG: (Dimethylallyl)adenosine tRNA methylthiotransferase MiaB [Syntrophorhabdus sp. PtaB.Bin047]|jgi:radical SAM superfamily enzyme YgiQ (UPF0313 family)|nr:MAG: (Dimethylallyl)adenosine tRNA methylthiotransferase MiaB [Syntrophorhabdus sp. PtaB.Bin047]
MRVTLVQPPSNSVYKQYKSFNRRAIKRFPFNLACLASYITERGGHAVAGIDADHSEYSLEETARAAIETGPDVIGLTSTTGIIDIVITIAGLIKEERPDIPIVLGGPHISAVRQEVLRHASVDFAVFGEGEASFLELLACIEAGRTPADVTGIAYRDGATLRANPAREHITDLDGLPMPMWDLFDCTDYHDFLIHGEDPYIILTTSRGCPYDCIYCGSKTTWGKKVRYYSPEYVVQELADLAARGIHNFTFVDDTFTLNKRRLKAICQGIIERDIRATFMCSSRVDTIDHETADFLKRAGCRMITFGVESASEKMLKVIKKQIHLDQVKGALAIAKNAGILTHTSYIIGCPGETRESVEQTIDFAIDMDPDVVQFSIFTPLPGTESWDYMDPAVKTDFDYSKLHWYGSYVLDNPELPAEYLIKIQQKAYEAFNARKEAIRARP